MSKNRAFGFSTVNLLIGLVLGLIVSAGVVQGLFSLKHTYQTQTSKLKLYENGRYALYYLRKAIGNSGYMGCYNDAPITVIDESANLNGLATFTRGVLGSEQLNSGFSPALSSFQSNLSISEGSDVISISAMSSTSYNLQTAMTNNSADLVVSSDLNATIGDVLVISDCQAANLLRLSSQSENSSLDTLKYDATYNLQNGSKSNNATLSKSYGLSAKVGKLTRTTLYLAKNTSGNNSLWLHQLSTGGASTNNELIEGVEQFKVLYGYDANSDGSANAYLSASNIANWENVVSMRIYLLLSSTESTQSSAQTYRFMGNKYSATDGKTRQEFSTTIKLNNLKHS